MRSLAHDVTYVRNAAEQVDLPEVRMNVKPPSLVDSFLVLGCTLLDQFDCQRLKQTYDI